MFIIRAINTTPINTTPIHPTRSEESEINNDILSIALMEENIEFQENEEEIFKIARKARNEKLLNTFQGQHIENYFNFTENIEIGSIWMTVKEFQNLRMLLKAYHFEDPPYGLIMKYTINNKLKWNFIENYSNRENIKHSICVNDIIIHDFKDKINEKSVVELIINRHEIPLTEIKYILQDLGDYFRRVLLVRTNSGLASKICNDIIIKNNDNNVTVDTLIYKMKLQGINIPDEVIENLSNNNDNQYLYYYDNVFEQHPISWLINNYYIHFYLKWDQNGNIFFSPNYTIYDKEISPIKSEIIVKNIINLIKSRQENGLSLQHFLGSYRKQYGEFPKNMNIKLTDYFKKANLFTAYYPQEPTKVRIFTTRKLYFENIKLGIKVYCNNKNYDQLISTKKIFEYFGIPSMTFLTNFFNDFIFISEWNNRNGSRQIYVTNLSNKKYSKQINFVEKKLIYSSQFISLFNQILTKNNGFVFLSDLNNQFIKHFQSRMDSRICIHKLLSQLPNIYYIPWNYQYSSNSDNQNNQKDKYIHNYCDQLLYDINNQNISSIVQIPILVKIFRFDFQHCQRILAKNNNNNNIKQYDIWANSTNYRDHLVEKNAFIKHLKRHGKLNNSQDPQYWSKYLKSVQENNVEYFALDHDAILDSLGSVFMPQQQQQQQQKQELQQQELQKQELEKQKQEIQKQEKQAQELQPVTTTTSSELAIYEKLENVVTAFESKLENVLSELQQQRQITANIEEQNEREKQREDEEFSKSIIDDNGHIKLSSISSFLDNQPSATSKQSLSVFSEETLKSMLLDCCKSGYSKPSINIAMYMAQNNILCNTEHYIGLMRIQYDTLAKEIWNEMIQRHFLSNDSFIITINTFQLMRKSLSDQWFKSLLLNNVQKLSNNYDDDDNDNDDDNGNDDQITSKKQNEEIMSIFLKYIQEYSQEDLAEWFSYHVKINKRSLDSVFWKKAALMLAVVFAKNASNIHHTAHSCKLSVIYI